MLKVKNLEDKLLKLGNKRRAEGALRFFKCGKGQYGEGDKFLGVTVPECREIAKQFFDMSLSNINKLIKSPWHEIRLVSLFILVERFQIVEEKEKNKIVDFYLKNTNYINNWDLVDASSYHIIGSFLLDRPRGILYKLVKSKILWERRIAIVSTFAFIKNNDFEDTLEISKILLSDKEDLIHKACGWMLREVAKRDKGEILNFIDQYGTKLNRTMLRYMIEKFPSSERNKILHNTKIK